MLSLVYKDLLLQRGGKSFIYMLIMPVLASFAYSGDILYAVMPFIAGSYLYIVYANAFDDKYNAEKTLTAMPVGRKRIVKAKYLSVVLYLAAFLAAVVVITTIITLVSEGSGFMLVFGWKQLVQFFFIAAIYYGVYFPIYFRVGYQRSRWANYISLIAAGGIFALATKGLSAFSGIEISSLQEALEYLTQISVIVWNIILPLLSILIIAISMRLSNIFYNRREF